MKRIAQLNNYQIIVLVFIVLLIIDFVLYKLLGIPDVRRPSSPSPLTWKEMYTNAPLLLIGTFVTSIGISFIIISQNKLKKIIHQEFLFLSQDENRLKEEGFVNVGSIRLGSYNELSRFKIIEKNINLFDKVLIGIDKSFFDRKTKPKKEIVSVEYIINSYFSVKKNNFGCYYYTMEIKYFNEIKTITITQKQINKYFKYIVFGHVSNSIRANLS